MDYFTADTHFGHQNILKFTDRGFRNVEEHDRGVMSAINQTVGEHDRLYILGDFAWNAEDVFFQQIRCRNVHLIIGNHDRPRAGKLFHTVQSTLEIRINGEKAFLSHYPHAYWPASHHGSYHLYGHTHGVHESHLDTIFPGRRAMDVGVDSAIKTLYWCRPFSADEIHAILSNLPGHDSVERYREMDIQRGLNNDREIIQLLQPEG